VRSRRFFATVWRIKGVEEVNGTSLTTEGRTGLFATDGGARR